jgi:hypothetical protein
MRFTFAVALAALWPTAANAADIPLGTVVRFNTVCAKCHEGECSGRLSFDSGHKATENHIRRYAGEVSPSAQRDLHTLLAYMKQYCAYYPIPVDVPQDRHWRADALGMLRSESENAYFVPLGELAAGRYRARLRFDATAEACAQIISESFDIEDYPGLRAESGAVDFVFGVERKGPYYLRLQTGKTSGLADLEIVPARQGPAPAAR